MKIIANDGKEFETVEAALAYEKAKEEKKDKAVQKLENLVNELNDTIDTLHKEGWKVEGEWNEGGLSITCTYSEASQKSYENLIKEMSRPVFLKDLLGGLL